MKEAAVLDNRTAAVEAALAGAGSESVRVIPRAELAEMVGFAPGELEVRGFHGLRVVADLIQRVVDFGARPPVAYLHQGWMWVDASFLEALGRDARRRDLARRLVRHLAMRATHPDWSDEELARNAPIPEPGHLEALRPMKPFPAPSHPFGMFRDGRGRWALQCPGPASQPAPDAVAGVVRVVLDVGPFYIILGGCVVDVDDDAIWVVTIGHHLPRALDIEVVIDGTGHPVTVITPDHGSLLAALAEERGSAVDSPQLAAAARALPLALLRVERPDQDPPPPPLPLATDVAHLASVLTVGYTSHPTAVPVLSDLFGEAVLDVPLCSAGVLEVGGPDAVGPNVNLSPTVRAREAGGGRAVIVVADQWATDETGGGAVLVESPREGTRSPANYELAGIVLAHHEYSELGSVTFVVDSTAIRALLRATRGPIETTAPSGPHDVIGHVSEHQNGPDREPADTDHDVPRGDSEPDDSSDPDAPVQGTPVTAWHAWRVATDGGPPRLVSGFDDVAWDPEAHQGFVGPPRHPGLSHLGAAPGFTDPVAAWSAANDAVALGQVEVLGDDVEDRRGQRMTRTRPLLVIVEPTVDALTVEGLAERYGVAIHRSPARFADIALAAARHGSYGDVVDRLETLQDGAEASSEDAVGPLWNATRRLLTCPALIVRVLAGLVAAPVACGLGAGLFGSMVLWVLALLALQVPIGTVSAARCLIHSLGRSPSHFSPAIGALLALTVGLEFLAWRGAVLGVRPALMLAIGLPLVVIGFATLTCWLPRRSRPHPAAPPGPRAPLGGRNAL